MPQRPPKTGGRLFLPPASNRAIVSHERTHLALLLVRCYDTAMKNNMLRCLGVSYRRISDPEQSAGDGEARQERDYLSFCSRHQLIAAGETYCDRLSGYKGRHRTKGRLGRLIQAAKDGQFEPDAVIVIEAWDRLGRMRPDKQLNLLQELLATGVRIGICRLDDIFAEADFGTHKWMTLAVFVQLAYQESKQKAERIAAAWESKRKR